MRYFAMIGGQRRGPFTLAQLHEAGVRPDTYVWCKSMADWEKAEDVADICRFYRQRIFDLMHPSGQPDDTPNIAVSETPSRPPVSLITISIFLIFFCFPPTGFVAFYYAMMCRKTWDEANSSSKNKGFYSDNERNDLIRKTYDYERLAKMWCGITFFLGFIFYALLSNFLL